MNEERERKVRERAYALWETEGRPSGRHDDHWHQANSEVSDAAQEPQREAPAQAAETPPQEPPAASPAASETPAAVQATAPAPRKKRTVKPKAK